MTCEYNKDNICTKKGCIFEGSSVADLTCSLCEYNIPKGFNEEMGKEPPALNVVIEGVGKEVEIVVNSNGGKQSASPVAIHLIDPLFLERFISRQLFTETEEKSKIYEMIRCIAAFMDTRDCSELYKAIEQAPIKTHPLLAIGKVLKEGAGKYEANNWRLIPEEEHINHALIHLLAAALGDTQDDHIEHALCRLMMASATLPSIGFSYTKYIEKV